MYKKVVGISCADILTAENKNAGEKGEKDSNSVQKKTEPIFCQPKPPCKICVFFAKNGKCYRANCKFKHVFQGSEKLIEAVPSKKHVATPIQRKTFIREPEAVKQHVSSMPKGFFGFANKFKKTVTPKSDSDEPIKRPLAADNKTEDEIVEPPPDKISKLNMHQMESKLVSNLNNNVPKEVAQLLKPVENINNNLPKVAEILEEVAQERNTGANQAETVLSSSFENPAVTTIKAKLVLGGDEREHEKEDEDDSDEEMDVGDYSEDDSSDKDLSRFSKRFTLGTGRDVIETRSNSGPCFKCGRCGRNFDLKPCIFSQKMHCIFCGVRERKPFNK